MQRLVAFGADDTSMRRTLPQEPCLFFRETPEWRLAWRGGQSARWHPDWRWVSFEEVGDRISAWRAALDGSRVEGRVAITGSPSVEALIADIAVRSLGFESLPVTRGESTWRTEGCEGVRHAVDACPTGVPNRQARWPPGVQVTDAPLGVEGRGDVSQGGEETGGCVVLPRAGAGWQQVARSRLEVATRRLGNLLEVDERPIVVHGQSLAAPGERVLIEWALEAGAAIAVPRPEVLDESWAAAEAALWIRPTILHGAALELESWIDYFLAAEGALSGARKRFRRLRWVLVTGSRVLGQGASDFYRGLGARVAGVDAAISGAIDRL